MSDFPVYEDRTEIVGEYIIFGKVSYDQFTSKNPLDEYDNGKIHSGEKNGYGEPHEFRAALGYDCEYGTDYINITDYQVTAATLVVLGLSEEKAREILTECIENNHISIGEIEEELRAKELPPLQTLEEVDIDALPMSVVQATLMFHAHEGVRKTYWHTASELNDPIQELAEKMAKHAIVARLKGDRYAVPLEIRRYQDTQIRVDEGKSFLDMDNRDGLWVPGDDMRSELDAMPYPEALQRAREWAASDAEMVSDWANGNVFDVDVYAYRLQRDEDGEPIEDFDHYDGEEAEYEEHLGTYYGDEHACEALKEHFGYAKAHVEGLQPSAPESALAP